MSWQATRQAGGPTFRSCRSNDNNNNNSNKGNNDNQYLLVCCFSYNFSDAFLYCCFSTAVASSSPFMREIFSEL